LKHPARYFGWRGGVIFERGWRPSPQATPPREWGDKLRDKQRMMLGGWVVKDN